MGTQQLYADEAISVTKLRSQISKILKSNRPVVILSHNEPAGYILNAEVYMRLVKAAERADPEIRSLFRPTADRLDKISQQSGRALLEFSSDQLAEFEEH